MIATALTAFLVTALQVSMSATSAPDAVAATPVRPPGPPVPLQLRRVAIVEDGVGVAARPGDNRLYILEKAGRIRALTGAVLDPTPALDLSRDTSTANERGLLGLAFAPYDPSLAYVTRTDRTGAVVLTEFPVDAAGRFDVARGRELWRLSKKWNDHNGGSLAFDDRGRLYVGIGDGGGVGDGPMGPGDPFDNAQNLSRPFGKVLRFDPRAASNTAPTIFAYGLRNPWRLTYDPAERVLWIPDVGQSRREELNRVSVDSVGQPNFGWKRVEGTLSYRGGRKPKGAVDPVHEYPHRTGVCAVIGGGAYRGTALPELSGWYLFGDLCNGSLSALRPGADGRWNPVDLRVGVEVPRGWGAGHDGEWYVCDGDGGVWRLERFTPAAV